MATLKLVSNFKSSVLALGLVVSTLLVAGCATNSSVRATPSTPTVAKVREFDTMTKADFIYLHSALLLEDAERKGNAEDMKMQLGRDLARNDPEIEVMKRTGATDADFKKAYRARYDQSLNGVLDAYKNLVLTKTFKYNEDGTRYLDANMGKIYSKGSISFNGAVETLPKEYLAKNSRPGYRQMVQFRPSPAGDSDAFVLEDKQAGAKVVMRSYEDVTFNVPFSEDELKKIIAQKVASDPKYAKIDSRRLFVSFDTTVTLRPMLVRNSGGVDASYTYLKGTGWSDRISFLASVNSVSNAVVK